MYRSSSQSSIPLPTVAIDVVMTTKRGQCYECGCIIYIGANSYCCSLCTTAPVATEESKEDKGDYALICSSPVCVMKHSLRDQHTMCTCKTCLSVRKNNVSTRILDPRCYHCNQLPGSSVLPEIKRVDEYFAFTIDSQGTVHRGHVWDNFSEASRYLTWCHGDGCPSPPFNIKPILFGSDYHYSRKEWSLTTALSKNETMKRFLARHGEKISTPSFFLSTLWHC